MAGETEFQEHSRGCLYRLSGKARVERMVYMEKYEYKVVTYDPQGFFGGNVKVNQIEK